MTRKKLPDGERLVVLTVRVPQLTRDTIETAGLIAGATLSQSVRQILNDWSDNWADNLRLADASPDNHPGA